jgi:hypothetical protein
MITYDISSSAIKSIEYDKETCMMDVTFHAKPTCKSQTYRFYSIDEETVEAFTTADSIGQYFNYHIKEFYNCVLMTGSQDKNQLKLFGETK